MKPRISHTIIRLWIKKDFEGMVEAFFHLAQIDTLPMQKGREFDEAECAYAVKNSRFSDKLGSLPLANPVAQDKWELDAPRYTLVGKPDVYDDTRIFELKTGKKSSLDYSKTLQLKIYFLLSFLLKKPRLFGYYLHRDLVHNTMDWHLVITSKEEMGKFFKEIDQICLDIVTYLETEGLI